MAKQTFTTGQVLTAAQMTSLQQTAMLGGAASAKIASYVLVAADAGDAITMSNAGATTITVDTGLFAAGDIVTIINIGAGACTITAGTATVTTSGSLVLAQNQGGVLRFTSPSAAIFLQFATPASSGDIEGVTAGTGISGGGTSGTVTVTNSMATAIDAKGDLVPGTGADTFARLAVGANDTVLTADSSTATGLKWAAPASGGGMTLLSTTSMSGSSTSVTSISGAYNTLFILVNYGLGTTTGVVSATLNSATSNYLMVFSRQDTTTNGGATASIPINAGVSQQDSGDGSVCQSAISIYNYASTSTNKPIQFGGNFRTGTSTQGINGAGTYVSSSAITSFQINTSAGTLEGTIRIYGVK
jgi:hypothetical protein